jgi:hypothetical protein
LGSTPAALLYKIKLNVVDGYRTLGTARVLKEELENRNRGLGIFRSPFNSELVTPSRH